MKDEEFFDELYQSWAKTTGSEFSYWMPEMYNDTTNRYRVYSVNQSGNKTLVASELNEVDAEFIAGVHGALPELIRRLHDAVAEADRADYDKDSRECRIFELELEVADLKQVVENLSHNPPWVNGGEN